MSFVAGARHLVCAVLAVVVVPSLVVAGGVTPAAVANPVISSVAPDPSLVRGADGAFHVYATSDDWDDGAGFRLLPHFRSFDLVEWEYVGDAVTASPAWAPPDSFLWAPDVHLNAAGAVMYYSTGGDKPCIGRATAPGIEGPWTHDDAPIVCHGDYRGELLDPMDPEVVVTHDGPVMLMGNFEGIHAVPMNTAGTALDGDPVRIAGTGVEAPAVVARDGYTHLFTSAGLCCDGEASQYRVLAGRAETLMGPYATRTGTPLLDGLAGDVILQGNDDWVGPGHVDVATDDADQDWLVYHAAPRGSAVLPNGTQRRYMMLDRVSWETVPGTEGAWPVVGGGTPTTDREAEPVVTLPVRLTAVGDVTLRAGGAGNSGDDQLDLSVRIDSTGAEYSGDLSATLTGPGKQRLPLQFVVDSTDGGAGQAVGSVPVSVTSGGSLTPSFALRPAARLAPGRYELVVAIGQAAGEAVSAGVPAVQELAVFGLEVAGDGSIEMASGALGSASLGSL